MYDSIINHDYDENNDQYCSKINCTSVECVKEHYFSFNNRAFIYKIVNQNVNDEQAWGEYEKTYSIASHEDIEIISSRTFCPIVDIPPVLTTYASLLKDNTNDVDDIDDVDDVDKLTETIINIRKKLHDNTKYKDNIKEQIRKLEAELTITENKIIDSKNQLKKLAVKIADC